MSPISSSSSSNDDVQVSILQATKGTLKMSLTSRTRTHERTLVSQNLELRHLGENSSSRVHKCKMITIVLDTPIYVINELGKSDLVPYGPPSHSKRSARGVFFNVSTSSESFDRESLVTVLNAYDPSRLGNVKFRMFSRGYESSHHVIEILVPSLSRPRAVKFDIPSVSLFDRSGHRLRISKLPVDIRLPNKKVHIATISDVVTPTLKPVDSCENQSNTRIASPLSRRVGESIRIPGE